MAESPLAIRVNEEIKSLFNELAEQGEFENKGDFLNRLLTLYQSEATKKDVSIMKTAIETVETLTTRLLDVLNGTAVAITTQEEKYVQELDEQRTSFEETRLLLQQRIAALESEKIENGERIQLLINAREEAESKTDELQNRIKELEQAAYDKQLLIDEYKEKLDTQMSIVTEYRQLAEESKVLHQEKIELTAKGKDFERQIDILKETLNRQAEQHTADIERLKDALNLEHEKAILELRKEHQEKIQVQQELYNNNEDFSYRHMRTFNTCYNSIIIGSKLIKFINLRYCILKKSRITPFANIANA